MKINKFFLLEATTTNDNIKSILDFLTNHIVEIFGKSSIEDLKYEELSHDLCSQEMNEVVKYLLMGGLNNHVNTKFDNYEIGTREIFIHNIQGKSFDNIKITLYYSSKKIDIQLKKGSTVLLTCMISAIGNCSVESIMVYGDSDVTYEYYDNHLENVKK